LASIIYWRTSPISIAAICNMCAGDGNVATRCSFKNIKLGKKEKITSTSLSGAEKPHCVTPYCI